MAEHNPVAIDTFETLEAIVGEPLPVARDKVRHSLHEHDLAWIAASPFLLLATADARGACDVSPKGDPAGFVQVLDDRTIVVPDRPGNRRVDGYRNILANPQVGLLFVVPGRGDTLRVNGSALLLSDAPYFDDLVVKGNRPRLALEVTVDEVFYHCAKAFLRSQLWAPESWPAPGELPSRARIAKTLERPDEGIEALEDYYGESYATRLCG